MANFKQVSKALKNGLGARREHWDNTRYCYVTTDGQLCNVMMNDRHPHWGESSPGGIRSLEWEDIIATDWQIVDPRTSMPRLPKYTTDELGESYGMTGDEMSRVLFDHVLNARRAAASSKTNRLGTSRRVAA
jgi:hypothetical protein